MTRKFRLKRAGKWHDVTAEEYAAHRTQQGHAITDATAPAEPTLAELAANFTGAIERWVAAGLPVVTSEQYAARSAACAACSFWDGAARLGFGKCRAPGCGCTKFKRWLATEQCKHPEGSRWAAG